MQTTIAIFDVLRFSAGVTGLVAFQIMLLATLLDICGYERVQLGVRDAAVSQLSFDMICFTVLAGCAYIVFSTTLIAIGA